MNSETEYDHANRCYRTTYTMDVCGFMQSFEVSGEDMNEARAAMESMRAKMEHEAFYGKPTPQPAPYAGDATFGQF